MSGKSLFKGQMILFRSSGSFLLGVFLDHNKEKINVLDAYGKKYSISEKKIAFISNIFFDSPPLTEKDLYFKIKEKAEEIHQLASSIPLEEIYTLIKDEPTEEGYLPTDIAEWYFSKPIAEEKYLAVFSALSNDSIYFKEKNERYFPHSEKHVLDIQNQLEATRLNEEKKQQEIDLAISWIQTQFEPIQFLEGEPPQGFSITESPPIEVLKLVESIRKYAIFKEDYDKKNKAVELLQWIRKKTNFRLKTNLLESAYILLEILHIFRPNENLAILKYNVPTIFSEPSLQSALLIAQQEFPITEDLEIYTDHTHLNSFTIDDETTEDMDDAFSMEIQGTHTTIYVHISEVDRFVPKDSDLDQEALQRGTSIYLPEKKISMLPPILSEQKISLREREIRPVVTFKFDLDLSTLEILDQQILLSYILVKNNYSYDQVDHFLHDSNHPLFTELQWIKEISFMLRKKRIQNGALDFSSPEIKVWVDDHQQVHLKKVDTNRISQFIVKEWMIYINYISSKFCYLNRIPAIYISQPAPDEPVPKDLSEPSTRIEILNIIRYLKKSEMSTIPTKHFSLGVSSYVQASSPIRRFHDLITLRQMKAFMCKKSFPYSNEDVQIVAATAEKSTHESKAIERENRRYWILKYLSFKINEETPALVTKKVAGGYAVELSDYLISSYLGTKAKHEVGDAITVTISKVQPRLETIFVHSMDG